MKVSFLIFVHVKARRNSFFLLPNFKVVHIKAENFKQRDKMRGSKYVQSDLGGVYERIEELLQAGMEVLFSGTPCQIAGLKVYLHDEYEKLLLTTTVQ